MLFNRKNNAAIYIMIFCLYSFTIGQFIPIYFIDSELRAPYYILLLIVLILTVINLLYNIIYKPRKNKPLLPIFMSILILITTFPFFSLVTFALLFNVWTESNVYYVYKENPKVKIISRYIDQGAFGGGTEPEDYHVVLHRPFLFLFKMETEIDTTSIDKSLWIQNDQ